MFLTLFKIAYRNVTRNRRKSMVTFLTVSLGIVSIVIAGGFFEYIYYQLYLSAVYGKIGHLQVSAKGFSEKGMLYPYEYMLPDFDDFLHRYGRLPHVRLVLPRVHFSGLISNGDTTGSFLGLGLDPTKEWVMNSALTSASGPVVRIIAGRYLQAEDTNGVVLGKGLAHAIGGSPGRTMTLLATTETGSLNGITVTIVGIFESFQKENDDHALHITIGTAQRLLRVEDKVHSAVFLLEDDRYTKGVMAELGELFVRDRQRYDVQEWRDLAISYTATVAFFRRMFLVINVVIALVVILGIANTISLTILERTREIGTVMAIGTKPAWVVLQFLLEGILLGVVGGLVGLLFGAVFAQVISAIGIPMPPPPGATREWQAEITPSQLDYLQALAIAILSGVAASLFPAIKASRLRVVDALRQV
jgi:putative ABC transport system permease protein